MITAKIQQVDINALVSRFKKAGAELNKSVADDLAESALEVRNGAIRRAPVDGGRLRGDINIRKIKPNGLLWNVNVKAKYAPYMEFGTGKKVNLTELTDAGFPETYAAQFKGQGIKQVNLQPKPFLFPSVNEEAPRLMKQLRNTIRVSGRKF